MKFGIGVLVLFLSIYTAKSFYVEKSGEISDDTELQRLSDVLESEIRVYPLLPASSTPRISSLFNFDRLNLLRKFGAKSSEYDEHNEIEKGDVIEIQVPVIGSEYFRRAPRENDNGDSVKVKGSSGINILTTQPTAHDISTTTDEVTSTFFTDFPVSIADTSSHSSVVETTTESDNIESTSRGIEEATTVSASDMQNVESKLMEQWKVAVDLIDDSFESEMFAINTRTPPKHQFNVKIVVNNEDLERSCKSKKSCNQVRERSHDIDKQFYSDYSDEDLFFKSIPERYYEPLNELRVRNARRAGDEIITPAPRATPQLPFNQLLQKPAFIEQLEKETSLERSERVNKNLDGLMRFISVWAQVDKFVSDRARGAIQKLAFMTGDDYGDYSLGSPRRKVVDTRRAVHDEPFT